jgi:hypothetical protein
MRVRGLLIATVALLVLACGASQGPSPSLLGEPVHEETVEGDYRLVLELASNRWAANTPIIGTASFGPVNGDVSFGASGQGPLGFAYRQVDGTRIMEPIWTADCHTYDVSADSPMRSDLKPSGGAGANDPDEVFYVQFSRASTSACRSAFGTYPPFPGSTTFPAAMGRAG